MKGLKEKRVSRGMSQGDLAKQVGVKYQTISHYEKGTRFPNRETLLKLARVLKCCVDEIL